jgi:dihydrofolate reductase
MSLNIIVAIAENGVIGIDGKIPWKIPDDVKLFKEITTGNAVLMGKKTFDSLPSKFRPLPDRYNVVLSRSSANIPGVDVCRNFLEGAEKARSYGKDTFVIGGASVYEKALSLAEKLFISHIKGTFNGDTYFPKLDLANWSLEEERDFSDFVFRRYRRRN